MKNNVKILYTRNNISKLELEKKMYCAQNYSFQM